MVRRRPPETAEGWYALHDLRRIDWDAWRDAPEHRRNRAIETGVEYLNSHEAVEDADAGASAAFVIMGHKADLLVLHLRPTTAHLDRAERRFESTEFAGFTERADSYVSVTEVSGYMHEDLSEGLEAVEDQGMRNYMQQRIRPRIPDAAHVCFYPMDKRRGSEDNWYDLPFEERREYMSAHGDIGREYAGQVTQIITGSVGLDDHEWGVTLFAEDLVDVKHLLYEMRFDPSTSRFAEFGSFYVGRRFPPSDLQAVLAGEPVPTDDATTLGTDATADAAGTDTDGTHAGTDADTAGGSAGGRPESSAAHRAVDAASLQERADRFGLQFDDAAAGYGLLFESDADPETVTQALEGLRSNFEHYDTHVRTVVETDGSGTVAIASLWANERAADTASGFLADLPGVTGGLGARLDDEAAEPSSSSDRVDATDEDSTATVEGRDADASSPPAPEGGPAGRPPHDEAPHEGIETETFRGLVRRFGIRLREHPDAGYALLFRSETDAEDLVDEVDALRDDLAGYDSHVLTTVRADSGDTAVISLWESERAADIASGFLADLSGAGPGVGTPVGGEDSTGREGEEASGETDSHGTDEDAALRNHLADLGIYAGQPHGEDVYALVLYSEADPEALRSDLAALREEFEEQDTHVTTAVYRDEHDAGAAPGAAVVSIWGSRDAADAAAEDLSALPGIVRRAGEHDAGFGTMGMFYTVKPDHRGDFVETFEDVVDALGEMEGHIDTRLLANLEDENDMFIASQWREKDHAMAFFRSEAFRDTVQWGREILDDRPRHVFLA